MTRKRRIKIYRWRDPNSPHGNFGDEITSKIIDKIFDLESIPVPMHKAELIGAGSILDHYWLHQTTKTRRTLKDCLRPLWSAPDLHVWGSGFILEQSQMYWPQRIHVHAVRGALTAGRVSLPGVTLGDPGLLASALVEGVFSKTNQVCLVPHFVDYGWVCSALQPELPRHWKVVNPEQAVEDVVTQIASSELVLSSSLHGLIVADSLRIPCVWIATKNGLYGDTSYKFYDYASSRGRALNPPMSYGDAFNHSAEALAEISTMPARSVSDWQREVLKAFPF